MYTKGYSFLLLMAAVLFLPQTATAQWATPNPLPEATSAGWDLAATGSEGGCVEGDMEGHEDLTTYFRSNGFELLVGQSFTAPCTGVVTSITVPIYNDGKGTASEVGEGELILYEGAGGEGTQLAVQPYAFALPPEPQTFEDRTVEFDPGVEVTAGEVYTFVFFQMDGQTQYLGDNAAGYEGGIMYATGSGDPTMVQPAEEVFTSGIPYDMTFQVAFAEGQDTAVDQDAIPGVFTISKVYPNPLNAEGGFSLQIEQSQNVRIAAYDMLGREIAILHEGTLSAASHTLRMNTSTWTSGVYFVSVRGENFSTTRKFVVAH